MRGLERRRGAQFRLFVPHLDVAAGEQLTILGPSGSGKSTLLDILALSLTPHEGRFNFCPCGVPVDVLDLWATEKPQRLCELRRLHIGYVLQTGGLLPFLSARENILLPARASHQRVDTALTDLAERLGLSGALLARKPAQLSIGERQRVAIARAVIHRPKLILADEPTASLDAVNAERTLQLLCDLVHNQQIACVLVTHNRELAERFEFPIATLRADAHTQRSELEPPMTRRVEAAC